MRRAFTLVQTLVVIAIITILAAILFPLFRYAMLAGKQANCAGNQRQILAATTLYVGDADDAYPPDFTLGLVRGQSCLNTTTQLLNAYLDLKHPWRQNLPVCPLGGWGGWSYFLGDSDNRPPRLCFGGKQYAFNTGIFTHAAQDLVWNGAIGATVTTQVPRLADSVLLYDGFLSVNMDTGKIHGNLGAWHKDRRLLVTYADGHSKTLPIRPASRWEIRHKADFLPQGQWVTTVLGGNKADGWIDQVPSE